MKSEHRHELKANELAQFIENFPTWAKENLKMIIYVSVVLVLIGGSYVYHKYQTGVVPLKKDAQLTTSLIFLSQSKPKILEAQANGFDNSYALIQLGKNLKAVADKTNDDLKAALALIKSAQAQKMELHYRMDTVNNDDLTKQINSTKLTYQLAAQKAAKSPLLLSIAKFGIGLCEEELANFKEAKAIYTEIAENPEFKGTTTAEQAKLRLNTMDSYKKQVVFLPAPQQIPQEPLMQPQIQFAPEQANLPTEQ